MKRKFNILEEKKNRNIFMPEKKKMMCQKDNYSLDTTITVYTFNTFDNDYLKDYKNI